MLRATVAAGDHVWARRAPPDETHAGKAAKWLAALLKQNPKMGKKTRKEDCMQLFDITSNTYDKRAWPEAHRLAGLPMRENNAE